MAFDPNQPRNKDGEWTLTWSSYKDPIFGKGFELKGLPEGSSASARRQGSGKGFVANAFINNRFMSHNANTLQSAMSRMNKEIDKRSIGLLNTDVVTFAGGKEVAKIDAAFKRSIAKAKRGKF